MLVRQRPVEVHAHLHPAVAHFLDRQYERHAAVDPSLPQGLSLSAWIAEASERTMVACVPDQAAHFTAELLALRQRAPELYERLARERARLVFCAAGSPATTVADLVLMAVERWLDQGVVLPSEEADRLRQFAAERGLPLNQAFAHLLRRLSA